MIWHNLLISEQLPLKAGGQSLDKIPRVKMRNILEVRGRGSKWLIERTFLPLVFVSILCASLLTKLFIN